MSDATDQEAIRVLSELAVGYLCRHHTSRAIPRDIGHELCCIGFDGANVIGGPTLLNGVANVGSDRESAIAWRGKEGVFIRMMVHTSSGVGD